ncbi:MAG: DNA translocase FtsK [Syntrophomonadaceae bacterium]|jgi:S-DNA-T family DNA segregation ATPase FtsK/SpoIIIE
MRGRVNKNTRSTGKKDKPIDNSLKLVRNEVVSIVIFVFAVFLWVSMSQIQGLSPGIEFIGILGTGITRGMERIFGLGAVLFSYFLLIMSIHIAIQRQIWSIRMWGLSILLLTILVGLSLYRIPGGISVWEAGLKGMGGGIVGGLLASILLKLGGEVGGFLFILTGASLGLVMILNKPLAEVFGAVFKVFAAIYNKFVSLMFIEIDEDEPVVVKPKEPEQRKTESVIINNNFPDPVMEKLKEPQISSIHPKADDSQIEEFASPVLKPTRYPNRSKGDYQIPPLDLLSLVGGERVIDKKNIKQSITLLENTFANFGISVKVNQVSCGPVVTRYELTPAPGVRVSRILSLTDDLQLNLASPGIRIEAPIPGKSAIGIEVPNSRTSSVGLRNLLSSPAFQKLKSPLAFALGEDISGNPVVAKIDDMPHLLIAGSTGSGKSVCLNSIIMSMLFNATPSELKMVFIDPKMVELTVYNGLPHLITPVVTDPKKASVVLRWMANEMEKRYKLFAENGVRDIHRYNQISQEPLPYILIVIDELADLMMVAPVEVEDSICRLAQMARAAGMHLIVATQRPSVDVVTGVIKANIPSRIAFAVSSQADSRTIIDTGGAEKLLGKGDMLFLPVGAVKPSRVQGTYVSDQDIERTVQYIKDQTLAPEESMESRELEISLENAHDDCDDNLFWEAVELFVDSQKASVSLLQRRLRIGYARAARIVDMMEERGIVSELDANKKREVLLDRQQLENLYARNKTY